ncbi:hypothetical protein LCGC14_0344670 [marine sediment metagenome]|uniref:Uncharacterized protein n=1 Tax=marine sediment metagenome TaxID=412755 RepID=A0A0F9W001_9ZZZZ
MGDIVEHLKYLSEEYESDEYVDISATNYFQEALDEIERLQVAMTTWKEEEGEWKKIEAGLLAQVKELEQFQRSLHPTELRDYTKTYYVIDDEMINKAWNRKPDPALATLAIFNIFHCERCPRNGLVDRTVDDDGICSDCHGRGWVVGGK